MGVKLTGFRELEKTLAELPKATGKNVLRRVGRKALEPMRAKAESLAPRDKGDLAGGIAISDKRTRRAKKERGPISGVEMAMGPSSGHGGSLNYATFDEFGTADASAQPFMRPAWDSEAQGAIDIIGRELGTEISKAAARRARKLAKG